MNSRVAYAELNNLSSGGRNKASVRSSAAGREFRVNAGVGFHRSTDSFHQFATFSDKRLA